MPGFIYNPSDYSPQNGHAGVYGNANAVNQDMFNSSAANWKDSTAFAYQQQAKYEDNALQIALMNYQNAYNSPYQQMQRYQQAGINPFDVVGKQSQPAASASPASGGSAKASKTQEQANKLRGAADMMTSLVQLVKGASTLQQDLQEISYRKETFPYQLSLLANKAHFQPLFDSANEKLLNSKVTYQPLLDQYSAQSAETSLYSKMYDALFNIWYMGLDPQDDAIPFGAYLPAIDLKKAFSESYKFKDSSSIRSLRSSLVDFRKWQKDFLSEKATQEMAYRNSVLKQRQAEAQERARHNLEMEMLAGAGLGHSVLATMFRSIFGG